MDSGTHALKRCVSELYNAHAGQPIIVIGGGPSAPSDLAQIPGWQSMLQISANGHGFKPMLGASPSFIFTKDNAECPPRPRKRDAGPFKLMEPQMRVFGVPLISIQYWADYRCVAWPFQGNSGQHALVVAALMGGSPVIGVGFDCFQGQTYFDRDERNISSGKSPGYWQMRYRRYVERFRGPTRIRGVSGVLVEAFGKYNPAENFIGDNIPPALHVYANMRTQRVETLRAFQDSGKATEIPAFYVVASNKHEADFWCGRGLARLHA